LLEEALTLFQPGISGIGDLGDLAGAYNALGNALLARDADPTMYSRAMDCWRQALALWEATGDLGGQARARHNLGLGHHRKGEWELALSYLRETDALGARAGNPILGAYAQLNVGACLLTQGRWDEALYASQLAVERAESTGQQHLVAQACANAGLICVATGNLDRADQWFERCSTLGSQLDASTFRWIGLRGLGQVAEARGLLGLAHERYRMANQVGATYGERYRFSGLIDFARIARLQGGAEAAEYRRQAHAGLADLREEWAVLLQASLSLEEGLALADAGEPAAAAASLREAIALADCVQTEPAEACALRLKAEITLGLLHLRRPEAGASEGHYATSRTLLDSALLQAKSSGHHVCLLDAQLAVAEAELACGGYSRAHELVDEARAAAVGSAYAAQAAWAAVLEALLASHHRRRDAGALTQAALAEVIALGRPAVLQQAHRLLGA
jgi:tetratricopeptide (TPR) repeat protein